MGKDKRVRSRKVKRSTLRRPTFKRKTMRRRKNMRKVSKRRRNNMRKVSKRRKTMKRSKKSSKRRIGGSPYGAKADARDAEKVLTDAGLKEYIEEVEANGDLNINSIQGKEEAFANKLDLKAGQREALKGALKTYELSWLAPKVAKVSSSTPGRWDAKSR